MILERSSVYWIIVKDKSNCIDAMARNTDDFCKKLQEEEEEQKNVA